MTIRWTPEQEAILEHPIGRHGRVLAGPGTGKSTTVLTLATMLQDASGVPAVGVITFTRAATAELALSAVEGGHELEPATLHSYALSLLMTNQALCDLPKPLRIPDAWESHELIHADIARRLKAAGFDGTKRGTVKKLERELAARWESMDPELELLTDVRPELRNAYLGIWNEHRITFGYSLFAEMPLKAAELVEDHPDVALGGLEILIVDEYQDLNRCEIGLLQALSSRGLSILAVGDDDQSIYSFRMADPSGIRDFVDDFDSPAEYSLSVSQRCGSDILDAARTLIETSPRRPRKPPLRPRAGNPLGTFEYLSFADHREECDGVATLIALLIGQTELRPSDIVVMLRGDHNETWSRPLRAALEQRGVVAVDVEQALSPLKDDRARGAIALGRLAVTSEDDLAWWTLLRTTAGISRAFVDAVVDDALGSDRRFASHVVNLESEPPADVTTTSLNRARDLVRRVEAFLADIDIDLVQQSDEGWAPFVLETAEAFGFELSGEFSELARNVGAVTPQAEGLGHFLNQLEPVTKDLALQVDGVAIMSMSRSKGLTRRVAITMGVESGVVPSPRATDEEEERRLLYVAMTRAKEYVYLTMATRRTGPTAFAGGGSGRRASRSRSPFFSATPIGPRDGLAYLREFRD